MKAKRILSCLLMLALCLLMLAGCGKESKGIKEQGKALVLNEVAHSIFYAPLYVAIEEGYFEEKGVPVSLVTGYGADKTMTALLTGEADIGFMGPESTIYTYLGGTEDPVINFAQLTQRAGNFLVAREQIQDFEWKDLEGAQVLGGRAGGMPQMVFEYILKKNGLNPQEDLSIDQSIDFGSTAAAFSGGQGEYTIEFEPHATLLEQKGDGYVIASLGEASGYVPYTSFAAKKSFIEANEEMLIKFTKAIKMGVEYVESHTPEEVAQVIAPQFAQTDPQTIAKIVERYKEQDTWKTDLVFEETSFTLLQNVLEEAGELQKRVPYEKLVTTKIVQK